jgi:hypothetical protein
MTDHLTEKMTGRDRDTGGLVKALGNPFQLTHDFGPRDENGLRPTVPGLWWQVVVPQSLFGEQRSATVIPFEQYERGV